MWLSTCREAHKQCRDQYDALRPSRIIRIQDDIVKLVLHLEDPILVSYVALSHCWGRSQPLRTTSENIANLQQGISHKSLPQTFKDAIRISWALDYKHLWIDSLCILQNDLRDWEEQSSMMASIYSNADLVLGAPAAESTT